MTSGSVWHSSLDASAHWTFVVGRSFLAVVNSGASARVIGALWSLADAAETAIEDVVAAVSLASGDGVHSFAVVSFVGEAAAGSSDRLITAVVRGAAVVDVFSVGGSRRFAAGEVNPWMLADFRSVTAVVLGGDDRERAPRVGAQAGLMPLARGVVTGNALLWSLEPLGFQAADNLLAEARPVAVPPLDVQAGSVVVDDDPEATIIRPRVRHVAAQPVERSPDAGDAGDGTVGDDGSIDDDTILISRSGSRAAPMDHPLPPLAAALPRMPTFGYIVGDGAQCELRAPTVFGRNPVAPRVIAGRTPVLVTVESPQHAVSSSHLRIGQEGAAVVVTDLRSTNGTILLPPGGKKRRMRPGESAVVLVGTRIDIGDGNIIEIVRAEQTSQHADSAPPAERGPE